MFCVCRQSNPLVVWIHTLISAQLRDDTTHTPLPHRFFRFLPPKIRAMFASEETGSPDSSFSVQSLGGRMSSSTCVCVWERATRRCLAFCQSGYRCEPFSPYFRKFPNDLGQLWCLISNEACNSDTRTANTKATSTCHWSVIDLSVRLLVNPPHAYFTTMLSVGEECGRGKSGTSSITATFCDAAVRYFAAFAVCVFLSPHRTALLLRNMMWMFAGQSHTHTRIHALCVFVWKRETVLCAEVEHCTHFSL